MSADARAEVAQPRLSVVVPVHGRPEVSLRALRSVLAQEMRELEVIVVDDGSPDVAEELLNAPELRSDSRVRVVHHGGRRGAATARNSGVQAARAGLVAFLDSDDEWLPGMASALLALVSTDAAGPVGATTGFVIVRPTGREERRVNAPRQPLVREAVRGCRLAPGSTMVIRRQAWTEVGGEDEGLPRLEDWDLLLRIARQGWELAHSDQALARVYQTVPGPAPTLVEHCASSIVARHSSWVNGVSPKLAKRLRGAAAWEGVVALAHHGANWEALRLLISSLGRTPVGTGELLLDSVYRQAGGMCRELRGSVRHLGKQLDAQTRTAKANG